MPRYEFSEGSSNKFWEITLKGSELTTRYGKIGTDGQTTLKSYGSPAEAKKAYDKLIAEKTGKGYREVGGGKPAAAAKPKPAKAEAKSATRAGVTRRFEFSEGTSDKFWEITVEGTTYTTCYGKRGTDGTETMKVAPSLEDAVKEADKLIAEKVKKGYVEVTGGKAKAAAKPASSSKLGPHLAAVIARIEQGKKRKPHPEIAALLAHAMPDDLRAFLTAKAERVHGYFTIGDYKIGDDDIDGNIPMHDTDMSEDRDDRILIGKTGGGDLFVVDKFPKGKASAVKIILHEEDWMEMKAAPSLDAFIYQQVLECDDPEMIDIELPS